MDDPITIAQPHYELYENFYKEINPSASSVISAGDAAAFLKKSNLSMQVLGQIWEFADYQKRGSLDKRGIFIAFKLVAAAQQGHPINSSSVFLPGLNPPSFASLTVTSLPQFNQNSAHSSLNQWAIDVADQVKYDSIFDSLCPVDGKLPGEKVRPVLLNSGLSPTSLAKIWELADQDKDGQLDRIEMTVALHLVYKTLQNDPIPFVLPPSLIHPSKAALSRRTSSLIAPPTCSAQNLTMSGSSLRSRTASVASLDGIGIVHTPVASHGDRSMSVQPNHYSRNGSIPGTPVRSVSCSTPSSEEWFVDRLASASQFAACDTDSDGLVSGNDVKEVLLATGLSQQVLAHIWALSDVNRTGTLNQEQFALVIHLINMKKHGGELPTTLPPHLFPPSLRVLFLPENGRTSVDVSGGNAASLGLPTETELPEMREIVEEMEKLLNERREADVKVTQLEADMTVKNSEIMNLQIELQTLESTVKQLERQKAEATRRLGDLDHQIQQLEGAGEAQRVKGSETEARLEQLKNTTEQSAVFAQRDQQEIRTALSEVERLEAEKTALVTELQSEQNSMESAIDEMTKLERELARDEAQHVEIVAEIKLVEKAFCDLQTAFKADEAIKTLKELPDLIRPMARNDLFDDTPLGFPSTSFQQIKSCPSVDPFNGIAHIDPFAQADPFISTPASGGFSASFPSDPFDASFPVQTSYEECGRSQAPSSSVLGIKAPPPPRPAPPKSTTRQTPINEDPFANTDSQAGNNQSASSGFADFSNFGAFN